MSTQALVKRKFVLYYDPDFAGGEERVQLVKGMDFFTEENGFSVYDIDDVGNMRYDATLTISYLRLWRIM